MQNYAPNYEPNYEPNYAIGHIETHESDKRDL